MSEGVAEEGSVAVIHRQCERCLNEMSIGDGMVLGCCGSTCYMPTFKAGYCEAVLYFHLPRKPCFYIQGRHSTPQAGWKMAHYLYRCNIVSRSQANHARLKRLGGSLAGTTLPQSSLPSKYIVVFQYSITLCIKQIYIIK